MLFVMPICRFYEFFMTILQLSYGSKAHRSLHLSIALPLFRVCSLLGLSFVI